MYWCLRSSGEDNYGWLLFLRSLSDSPVLYCYEDTGHNPHYHYLFVSKIEDHKKLLGKKSRFKYVPKEHANQFNAEKISLPTDRSFSLSGLRGTLEDMKKYLCKGHNVKRSKMQSFFNTETGVYTGEPPVVFGMTDAEVSEYHNSFWKQFSDNNHKYHNVKEKKATMSGLEKFINFYQSAEVKFSSDATGSKRCREHLKYITELAYQYCKRMTRDSVHTAVNKLVHAAMLEYDDTGKWEGGQIDRLYKQNLMYIQDDM